MPLHTTAQPRAAAFQVDLAAAAEGDALRTALEAALLAHSTLSVGDWVDVVAPSASSAALEQQVLEAEAGGSSTSSARVRYQLRVRELHPEPQVRQGGRCMFAGQPRGCNGACLRGCVGMPLEGVSAWVCQYHACELRVCVDMASAPLPRLMLASQLVLSTGGESCCMTTCLAFWPATSDAAPLNPPRILVSAQLRFFCPRRPWALQVTVIDTDLEAEVHPSIETEERIREEEAAAQRHATEAAAAAAAAEAAAQAAAAEAATAAARREAVRAAKEAGLPSEPPTDAGGSGGLTLWHHCCWLTVGCHLLACRSHSPCSSRSSPSIPLLPPRSRAPRHLPPPLPRWRSAHLALPRRSAAAAAVRLRGQQGGCRPGPRHLPPGHPVPPPHVRPPLPQHQ